MLHFLVQFTIFFQVSGWSLLTFTTASLLLPNPKAASDRFLYAVTHADFTTLLRLLSRYFLVLPAAAFLWITDDILYSGYRSVNIEHPVIVISLPRAGTTSFHRTLALDERFVTPTMLELFLPFLCLQKVIWSVNRHRPGIIHRLETFLKNTNGVTPEIEARHPVHLLAPDADDILLSEWHWVSVGSVRTFSVPQFWLDHYQMTQHRRRSMLFHRALLQKVVFHRGGGGKKRLLLRSHLSPCIPDFQELYPAAVFVGILRDPVAVLLSFAGLSSSVVMASTGVDMLADPSVWGPLFCEILNDMMGKESALYSDKRNCSVRFNQFQSDPLSCLVELYSSIGIPMTSQMQGALRIQKTEHISYKSRHAYHNPTLQQLGIDLDEYCSRIGVEAYSSRLADLSTK